MKKAASGSGGGNSLILGLVLIAGAVIYSRQARAQATFAQRPLGTGSMSGATGSGTAQIVGGLLGGVASWLSNQTQGLTGVSTMPILSGNDYDPADPGGFMTIGDIFKDRNDPNWNAIPSNQDLFDSVVGQSGPNSDSLIYQNPFMNL